MDIIKMLSIKKKDEQKWAKYYSLETSKYYDYIINILPDNQNILEIGSGCGEFYSNYKDILTEKNNKYTCIDIHKPSIEYAKKKCDYVDFFVKDICDFTEKELEQYDLLLLVQSYIVIPNIEKVVKQYFIANPNGCIMMVNTVFPSILRTSVNIIKRYLSTISIMNYGKSLTLNDIDKLGHYLDRTVTNTEICKSLSGFSEYLTIIR